jgi:hypothetical protein
LYIVHRVNKTNEDNVLTFVRVEQRGPNGTRYYYLCSYNPTTRNVRKEYLGPWDNAEAQRKANFFKWIATLDKYEVKRLRNEYSAMEKLGPDFHTSLERVLELGRLARQEQVC